MRGLKTAGAIAFGLALLGAPARAAPASPPAVAASADQRLIAQGDAEAGQGRFAEAEKTFRDAVRAAASAYGQNDLRTSLALARVALAVSAQGRYADAETIQKAVVQINEAVSGPASMRTALALHDLADAVGAQGRYAEAATVQRRALSIAEQALPPTDPGVAREAMQLGLILDLDGKPAEAEPQHRRAMAIYEKAPGRAPVVAVHNLGRNLKIQRRFADAEPLLRRALALAEAARPQNELQTGLVLNDLGQVLLERGRYRDAETQFRRRLALLQAAPPRDGALLPTTQYNLGLTLLARGRFDEAESLQRQAAAGFERLTGGDSVELADSLTGLSASLLSLEHYADAERLLRRVVAMRTRLLGADHPRTLQAQAALADALFNQGQAAGAEALQRETLARQEQVLPKDDPGVALTLHHLAASVAALGRPDQAEPLERRALALAEQNGGRRDRQVADYATGLAAILQAQGKDRDAEPLLRRALAIDERLLGKDHAITANVKDSLAFALARSGRPEPAVRGFRGGCRRQVKAGGRAARGAAGGAAGVRAGLTAAACEMFHAASAWEWAQAGGGPGVDDRPDALMAEAFLAAQRADISTPGQALSFAAARRAAALAGAGQEASEYEQALAARAQVDALFLDASAEPDAAEQRDALSAVRAELDQAIPRLEAKLAQAHPRYWALRSPQPVGLAALQARSGRDAALLREDEALIVLTVPAQGKRGLVVAVTKDRAAWAQIAMGGEEMTALVLRLRNQLSPLAYSLRGRDGQAEGPPAPPPSFDRQAAYGLYQALLGAPAIQAVLKDKPVWLFAPSGPMTALPPSLLVTAPPAGGAAGDSDPEALRATAWLVRTKAVAIVPGVASLRLMRQAGTRDAQALTEPLLAMADPDFAGRFQARALASLQSADDYVSDAGPRAEQLASLPPLPGTRVEGLDLLAALGGAQDGLMVGPDATETALRQRNASGRLARTRVLEFATHGLVWGDFDVAEPSIALAAPPPGSDPQVDDGLLTASEAAGLRLNADWVILSACNTAGPSTVAGNGLSGLASGFLYAGAGRVLATHWPVRDDVPPRLIPAMLKLERDHPEMARAEAMRQAMVEVLDDPKMGAYYPGAWAPFVLVGEGR